MTYRSSEAQLANLKPKPPKSATGLRRSTKLSMAMIPKYRELLTNELTPRGMTIPDLVEAIAIRLEKGEITIDDLLGK